MSSSSTASSMTARPVTHSLALKPTLQLPPSPFLLFSTSQPLDRPQITTESIPNYCSAPPSQHQTEQPPCCSKWSSVPAHSGSCFSHMDMPNTPSSPTRTVSQPSCPPAPRRQAPLRLYGSYITSDSQSHVSDDVLPSSGNTQDPHTLLPAAAGDTAVSLRRLVANAEAVSTLQDMLGRLRQDAPKVAHTEVADSAGSSPAVAMPVPGRLKMNESPSACQDALQAKRIKLFGHARSSFLQTHCFRSSSTEAPPVQPQRRPLTVQSDPYTVPIDPPTVQSDPPTVPIDPPTVQSDPLTVSDSDHTGHVTCQTSGLPEGAVALRTHNDSGFPYPHKVRRLQLPADTTAVVLLCPAGDSPSSPTHGLDAEMAIAPAPTAVSKGGTGAPVGSSTLSGEGQSWPAVSAPTAVALTSPESIGTVQHALMHRLTAAPVTVCIMLVQAHCFQGTVSSQLMGSSSSS